MNRTIRPVGNDEWELASYVVERHPGLWTIAFQHDNTAAEGFWRRVATEQFGP
jgi:predicted acetyltransferase